MIDQQRWATRYADTYGMTKGARKRAARYWYAAFFGKPDRDESDEPSRNPLTRRYYLHYIWPQVRGADPVLWRRCRERFGLSAPATGGEERLVEAERPGLRCATCGGTGSLPPVLGPPGSGRCPCPACGPAYQGGEERLVERDPETVWPGSYERRPYEGGEERHDG